MRKRSTLQLLIIFLLALAALVACDTGPAPTPTQPPTPLQANFYSRIETAGDHEIVIDLGVHLTDGSLPAGESLDAYWRLADTEGTTRAHGFVDQLPEPTSGASANQKVLAHWKGTLQPGAYELVWGAPSYGSTLDHFDVTLENGQVRVTNHQSLLSPEFPPVAAKN